MRTNAGTDLQARALGAFTNTRTGASSTPAPTGTSITLDGVAAPGSTSAWNGQIVVCGAVFGVILSNTNVGPTAPPVLTIDRWYDPSAANLGGTPPAAPASGRWQILPGMAPAQWMAITTDTAAPAATDTTLASEQTLNGLGRALCTYGHTGGAASYTLMNQFGFTGTTSTTLAKIGIFNAANGGIMLFETALSSNAIVAANGDTVTVTETVSM